VGEPWRKHFKNKTWGAIESEDHCWFSYLRSVDRFFDQSSTTDNIQDVNGIVDDEHRCDQVHNKHCLKIDMKQVQNKSPRERHKYQCYLHLPFENSHRHYLSSIDHIERAHSICKISLQLSTKKINKWAYRMVEKSNLGRWNQKSINVRRIKNKNQWYLLEKNKNEITDYTCDHSLCWNEAVS
jgi:hypothetical protein